MQPALRDAAEPLPPIEVPTVTAHPDKGRLAGRTIVFRLPPTRMWIAMQRGEFDNAALYGHTLDAIVDHDLGVDPESLPPAIVADLASAWLHATREAALPSLSGDE
jgi:hypothetical protein